MSRINAIFNRAIRPTCQTVGLAIGLTLTGFGSLAYSAEPVTVVIMASPSADGADARKTYSQKVNPLGAKAGIEVIKGVNVTQTLVGDVEYGSIFLLGFSDEVAAKGFFSSEEYQALIPLRDAGYEQYDVLIGK